MVVPDRELVDGGRLGVQRRQGSEKQWHDRQQHERRQGAQHQWHRQSHRQLSGRGVGISSALFEKKDIHVHVPEGATPKDGPSAGVAMVTAIVSIMAGIPVRKDVAMTGEITLRGRVLPIGGLKEKLLAALRAGIKTVVIPEENVKDLAEIGDEIKAKLEILPASRMDDVLKIALQRVPQPLPAEEEVPASEVPQTPSQGSERVTH